MISPKCLLLFGLLLTLFLDPTSGRKGFGGHSYPKSGGLSGGGHRSGGLSGGGHGYPSSGGSHGYPSGGLSGGGSHSYPSSGGSQSHSYPSPGGSHGYPSSGGSHGYPSSGGSHGYPSSGGLSGSGHGYPSNKGHTTNVYNYHYSPPQQITYAPVRGGIPQSYPVYRGPLPTYVHQYKDSGSKYGTLLTGLALLNLGTVAGAAYAISHNNHGSSSSSSYKPVNGEICKFAVKKDNGDYEETKIDCQIISNLRDDSPTTPQKAGTNSTVTTTTTVTNVTIVNNTNVMPDQTTTAAPGTVLYAMLPNGTLVPVNATVPLVNTTANEPAAAANGTITSSVTVTTTTTNTTLANALDVKGKPVEVTPGMQCFVIRQSPVSNMRKTIPCGLLQTYADKSLRRNSASQHAPMFTIAAAIVAYLAAY